MKLTTYSLSIITLSIGLFLPLSARSDDIKINKNQVTTKAEVQAAIDSHHQEDALKAADEQNRQLLEQQKAQAEWKKEMARERAYRRGLR